MSLTTARALTLRARPAGRIEDGCLRSTVIDLPALGPDALLVRNRWMSIDPYMYLRMRDEGAPDSYEIGDIPDAMALGEVIASTSDRFHPGDRVISMLGWREAFVAPAAAVQPVPGDFDVPEQGYISLIGITAFTAWTGMIEIAQPRSGEVIFISGAAGAVGMIACQIARNQGLRVIASAGSDAKCAWLREMGASHAINYRAHPDLTAALREAAPDGIDLYFDNVGGDHLEAAIEIARQNARFIECGMISTYLAGEAPAAPRNLVRIIAKGITLHGYTVADYFHLHDRYIADMRGWMAEGRMVGRETVFEGLDAAPEALRSLFGSENIGKTVVRL